MQESIFKSRREYPQNIDVLIVITSLQLGGAETQAVLWAKNLKKNGVSVCVVSLFPGPLKDALDDAEIPYFVVNMKAKWVMSRPYIFLKSLMLLLIFLKQLCPKKVVSFLYIESLLMSILKKVFRNRFSLYMGRRADFGYGGRGLLQNHILSQGYKEAERVFTNSVTNLSSAINDGVDIARVVKIENFLRPDLCEAKKVVRRNQIDKEIVRCLTVGSLTSVKNHSLAIALVKLWKEAPRDKRLTLDICGEGELRIQLEKQIGSTEEITLLGGMINPWINSERYDFYIHTSRSEGSSNVLWEAAAIGLPIISTPVGDIEDLRALAQQSVFIAYTEANFIEAITWMNTNLESIKDSALKSAIGVRKAKSPEKISQQITTMLGI